MKLFRKKDKPPKDTSSVEFKRYVAAKLNGRSIRYILERSDNTDRVIGKGGFIAVTDGILSVICGEKTLFSAQVDTLEAWEFLSLEGVTLTGYGLTEGKERTVMAYYKYYRD